MTIDEKLKEIHRMNEQHRQDLTSEYTRHETIVNVMKNKHQDDIKLRD